MVCESVVVSLSMTLDWVVWSQSVSVHLFCTHLPALSFSLRKSLCWSGMLQRLVTYLFEFWGPPTCQILQFLSTFREIMYQTGHSHLFIGQSVTLWTECICEHHAYPGHGAAHVWLRPLRLQHDPGGGRPPGEGVEKSGGSTGGQEHGSENVCCISQESRNGELCAQVL